MEKENVRDIILFQDLNIIRNYFEKEIYVKKILMKEIIKVFTSNQIELIEYLKNDFNFCKFLFCYYYGNFAFQNSPIFSNQDFSCNISFLKIINNQENSNFYLSVQEILSMLNLSKKLYYEFFFFFKLNN